jgi:hypothetical protein
MERLLGKNYQSAIMFTFRFIGRALAILCLVCAHVHAYPQTTLSGVYGGLQTSLAVTAGAGMNRTDHVVLFRPDGSFDANLHKPDWKTATTGHYTISGNKVVMTYVTGGKDYYEMKNGDLWGSGYWLLKMDDGNAVPPGSYTFTNGSSMGGMGTGMTYVGTTANVGLQFDGKGNFSRNASAATVVAGGNVGGGSSNNSSGTGTYTIQDGVLTLHYANGKTETHSFFSRPGEKPVMAAVDGGIYFMDDPSKATRPGVPAANLPGAATASAKDLLLKANQVQGGSRLDALRTVKTTAAAGALTLVTKIDLVRKKQRLEIWKGSTLANLKQAEVDEYSGILGLRNPMIARLQTLQVKRLGTNTSVVARINGNEYIYLLNDQGQLIGDGTRINGTVQTSIYSDFRTVDGLLLPFGEWLQINGQKLQVRYTQYEINPSFSASDWQ